MSKIEDYQRFAVRMHNVTNRPVFLRSLFDRGMTVEEATAEMGRMKDNGVRMFKYTTHGSQDRPRKKDRIMTLEVMQRTALKGAFLALRAVYHRRATPEAREWRETQMDAISAQIRRGED